MSTHVPHPSTVRTYRGKSLAELIPRIREELGPDAIILREREGLTGGLNGFFAQRCVEVDAQAAPRVDFYDEDEDALPEPETAAGAAHSAASDDESEALTTAWAAVSEEPAAAVPSESTSFQPMSSLVPDSVAQAVAEAVAQAVAKPEPTVEPVAPEAPAPAPAAQAPTPEPLAAPREQDVAETGATPDLMGSTQLAAEALSFAQRLAQAQRERDHEPTASETTPPGTTDPVSSLIEDARRSGALPTLLANLIKGAQASFEEEPPEPAQPEAVPAEAEAAPPQAEAAPPQPEAAPQQAEAPAWPRPQGATAQPAPAPVEMPPVAPYASAAASYIAAQPAAMPAPQPEMAAPAPTPAPQPMAATAPAAPAAPPAPAPQPVVAPTPAPQPVAAPAPAPQSMATPAPMPQRTAAEAVAGELAARGISPAWAQDLIASASAHGTPFASGADLRTGIRAALASAIAAPRPLPSSGAAVAFVGAGGAGKSRCAAAMAAGYGRASSLKPTVIALDGAGSGAGVQTLLTGRPLPVRALDGAAAADAVTRGREGGMVIVDTPATSPVDGHGVGALAARLAQLGLDAVYLAVPATLSASAARHLLDGLAPLRPSALVITHADESDELGIAAELAYMSGLPIAFIHGGLDLERSLRPVNPAQVAARLLP